MSEVCMASMAMPSKEIPIKDSMSGPGLVAVVEKVEQQPVEASIQNGPSGQVYAFKVKSIIKTDFSGMIISVSNQNKNFPNFPLKESQWNKRPEWKNTNIQFKALQDEVTDGGLVVGDVIAVMIYKKDVPEGKSYYTNPYEGRVYFEDIEKEFIFKGDLFSAGVNVFLSEVDSLQFVDIGHLKKVKEALK